MDVSSIQPTTPASNLLAQADRALQLSQQRRGGLDVQRNLASLQANIDGVRQARANQVNQYLNPQGSVPPLVPPRDDTY